MFNAKQEWLGAAKGKRVVRSTMEWNVYDQDVLGDWYFYTYSAYLRPGYTESDFSSFLWQLDFDYDDEETREIPDGIIWFEDGSTHCFGKAWTETL